MILDVISNINIGFFKKLLLFFNYYFFQVIFNFIFINDPIEISQDRLWRKTRSKTPGSRCVGADANRNFYNSSEKCESNQCIFIFLAKTNNCYLRYIQIANGNFIPFAYNLSSSEWILMGATTISQTIFKKDFTL